MVVDTVTGILARDWKLLIGLLAVGLLVYWLLDEREDASDVSDLIEGVGGRAESATGGVVGAFGSLVIVITSIMLTVGRELLATTGDLGMLVEGVPVVIGHILVGVLAWAGFTGAIQMDASTFGWAFILITIVALGIRYDVVGGVSS